MASQSVAAAVSGIGPLGGLGGTAPSGFVTAIDASVPPLDNLSEILAPDLLAQDLAPDLVPALSGALLQPDQCLSELFQTN